MARILHALHDFATGGVQSQLAAAIDAMPAGYEHRIVALNGDLGGGEAVRSRERVSFEPGPPRRGPLSHVLALAVFVRARKPDLVVTYDWAGTDVALAALLVGVRRIIHAQHGIPADELAREKTRRLWLRRLLFRRVSRLVVPSNTLRRLALESWKVPRERLVFIPSTVDVRRFAHGDRAGVRRRLGIPAQAVVVGTVARLAPIKNQALLIDAVAALADTRDLHLLIVGDGPERAALERRARSSSIADRATFTGLVAEPADHYHAMDVFALSSFSEQRPLSLLEAMAAGKPAVATDVGDIRDMVCDANRPFVVSQDTAVFTAALRRLLDSGDLRRDCGAANRERCRQLYDLQVGAAAYRDLFQSVLG